MKQRKYKRKSKRCTRRNSLPSMYAIKKPGTSKWWGNQARDKYHFAFGWGPASNRNRWPVKSAAKYEAKKVGGEVYQVFKGGWTPMKVNPRRRR